ncbi:MAG: hypothetical protein ABR541_02465 [Candidatus Dormibacteria bacterium]
MPSAPVRRGAGGEQPSLPLSLPVPPALPGQLRPELSVPCTAAFDDDGWRFGVDWDGCRALLFSSADGSVRLQGERLDDLTSVMPELAAGAAQLGGRASVLDGVAVVLDPEGRPDLGRLTARLRGQGGAAEHPIVYLVTDLLHLDGVPTLRWPLDRRLDAVARLLAAGEWLQHGETMAGDGRAFTEAAAARGLPAVLARRRTAEYHPGVASSERLRISLSDRTEVVIAAVEAEPEGGLSLHLAELSDGRWVGAGVTVVSPAGPVGGAVLARVEELLTDAAIFDGPARPGLSWLRPDLVASVRHDGRLANGRLRRPECLLVRRDVQPERCHRRSPVAPPGDNHPGFVPTVLSALPIDARR